MLRCSDHLPGALYTAEQVRALDTCVIDEHGVPGIQLMLKASRALLSTLESQWPGKPELQVFCGKGNNAGDAYLVAALAVERGYTVTVWQVGEAPAKGDALTACERAREAGVSICEWQGQVPASGLVIDALLGTGLKGDVRPAFAEAVRAINDSGLPVLAVDIPSGLCADTGRALGVAVRAAVTVTFVGLKRGLFTGEAADHVGHVFFSDLEAPPAVYATQPEAVARLTLEGCLAFLPARRRTAHKGHFGHVLVVGGDTGMAGAVILAASAAARSGAGLVSCATRPAHTGAVLAQRPEVMVRGVEAGADVGTLLAKATVVVVGPGLGQDAWGQDLLAAVLKADKALVLDADALNLLASTQGPGLDLGARAVITPHPGEAARLLDCSTAEVAQDRFAAASELRKKTGATVLLKGAGTVLADERGLAVMHGGNPGMASGGMGDVLSGILGALLAQGLSPSDAVRLGACVHAAAADRAAESGERGMLAGDLVEQLRSVLNW